MLVLDAPAIAAAVQPGQFVMLKPSRAPIRCCGGRSRVFEVMRDRDGAPSGISILNKTHRRRHVAALRRGARRDDRVPRAARPAVRSRSRRRREAWMVAGGVGLAPFVTLAARLAAAGHADDAVLRRAHAPRSSTTSSCSNSSASTRCSRRKTAARGTTGRVTAPLGDALQASRRRARRSGLYVCGPTPMMRAVARLAAEHARAPATSRSNRSWAAAWAAATAAWC